MAETQDYEEGGTPAIETDPVFVASPAYGITTELIADWNEAFSWGDHAGLYDPAGTGHAEATAHVTAHEAASDPHTGYIKHSLATAVSDFLVASGVGVFVKKTLAEVKAILGLGDIAAENAPLTVAKGGTGVAKIPFIHVCKNADQAGIAPDTPTKITWPVEVSDSDGYFASDRFTPLVPGRYLIIAYVLTDSASPVVGKIVRLDIYKNGGNFVSGPYTLVPVVWHITAAITSIVSMNGTTDYLEIWFLHNFTENATIIAAPDFCWWQAIWMGP